MSTPPDPFARAAPLDSYPPGAPGGDPWAGSAPSKLPMEEFHARLVELTPHVYVTWVLLAINLVVYAAIVIQASLAIGRFDWAAPNGEMLLAWGANFGPRTIGGEWWRVLTCTFLHAGILHLGMNMFCLATAGPMVERMLGNIGFLVLYLLAGLGGSAASLLWNPIVPSVGASGAIFGIYGALLAVMLRQHDAIPAEALIQVRNSGLAFVGFNLLFGFTTPNIGNAAHIGGLATGFLLGVILGQPLTLQARGQRWIRDLAALILGSLAVGGALFGVQAAYGDLPAADQALGDLDAVKRKVDALYSEGVERAKRGEGTDSDFVRLLVDEVLPDWGRITDRLAALRGKALPRAMAWRIDALADYTALRREAWQLLVEAVRESDPGKFAQANEKQKAANEAVEKFNQEVQAKEGKQGK